MEPTTEKRRIALLLQYDGTHFNGWQIQENQKTIQGELERALKILSGEQIRVIASGRTDTGVHALHQVVHFDTCSHIELDRLCIGLNGILSTDIAVKNAYFVDNSFHARFSVKEREYTYLIYNNAQRTPFMHYRAMWVRFPLDICYMKKIVSYIIGEKDFAAFCKKKSNAINTVRRIHCIEITRDNDIIKLVIKGTAFLHNMIRIIIGTIIEIIKQNEDPETVCKIIESKDRDRSGFTAPAYGLYLSNIIYDPHLNSYKSAF